MVVGEMAEPCDLLVIGGGPGGYTAALRAARLGRKVVLVERGGTDALGGTCLHLGCIPSKALIELASARRRLETQVGLSVSAENVTLDMPAFADHLAASISKLTRGVQGLLSAEEVQVVHGRARFNRIDQVAVELDSGQMLYLSFKHAIVATGSLPVELPGLEPDGERVFDSDGVVGLRELPAKVAIVGAGYIGIELGTAMSKLGSDVTLIEAGDRILPNFDAELTRPILARLRELDVTLHLRATAQRIYRGELIVESAEGETRVAADSVIVAVGRKPNTADLGLREAGIACADDGTIPVDGQLRVNERVSAIGDVVEGPALEHKATHQGLVAAEALCGLPSVFDAGAVPEVAFTDPEIATVGLEPEAARASGLDVLVQTLPLSALGRMATLGDAGGFARLVCDRGDDRIVGAQIVAPHATELIAEAALAIEMVASPVDLASTIHPHPTISEAFGESALALVGTPFHVPAK